MDTYFKSDVHEIMLQLYAAPCNAYSFMQPETYC